MGQGGGSDTLDPVDDKGGRRGRGPPAGPVGVGVGADSAGEALARLAPDRSGTDGSPRVISARGGTVPSSIA